jgi:phospholipid/cholesterol/gamma-HCH transport system substrate-binding protein
MNNKSIDSAKLGMFVLAGLVFMILMLYMIGKNRNLLGQTFTIKARMTNVNGLVPGNNVRFKGIDVGTVKSMKLENDSFILVSLVIDENVRPFLRKNAIASVGTDGLMGNKLINITSQGNQSPTVSDGEIINSVKPIETDEMLRTLNTTNKNIERISGNLFDITEKLNRNNSLWTILSDTAIAIDLKEAVSEFKHAGRNTSEVTSRANKVIQRIENGSGLAYQLFIDSTLAQELATSVDQLKNTTRSTQDIMEEMKTVMANLKDGQGTAGLILNDSLFRERLFKSAENIEHGTDNFNQNMNALKKNFLFRRYFKKLEKEKQQTIQSRKNGAD